LDSFLIITNAAQFFATFSHGEIYALILTKFGWAMYLLGDFKINYKDRKRLINIFTMKTKNERNP
jgi:hypothetical protein